MYSLTYIKVESNLQAYLTYFLIIFKLSHLQSYTYKFYGDSYHLISSKLMIFSDLFST